MAPETGQWLARPEEGGPAFNEAGARWPRKLRKAGWKWVDVDCLQ